ncbi:expressed unknown protein [Seminavis robusta]|uniref:Uncharacterized protein n=1 Tax=Seminavis robusta TaxID=568900 RepID=A0A9N8EAZ7_9STRA|nr:expressed unknown protein [Seminavis robusta]|eukprot:Sro702_g189970.1 n/a (583) ;mRNA; f:30060-31808
MSVVIPDEPTKQSNNGFFFGNFMKSFANAESPKEIPHDLTEPESESDFSGSDTSSPKELITPVENEDSDGEDESGFAKVIPQKPFQKRSSFLSMFEKSTDEMSVVEDQEDDVSLGIIEEIQDITPEENSATAVASDEPSAEVNELVSTERRQSSFFDLFFNTMEENQVDLTKETKDSESDDVHATEVAEDHDASTTPKTLQPDVQEMKTNPSVEETKNSSNKMDTSLTDETAAVLKPEEKFLDAPVKAQTSTPEKDQGFFSRFFQRTEAHQSPNETPSSPSKVLVAKTEPPSNEHASPVANNDDLPSEKSLQSNETAPASKIEPPNDDVNKQTTVEEKGPSEPIELPRAPANYNQDKRTSTVNEKVEGETETSYFLGLFKVTSPKKVKTPTVALKEELASNETSPKNVETPTVALKEEDASHEEQHDDLDTSVRSTEKTRASFLDLFLNTPTPEHDDECKQVGEVTPTGMMEDESQKEEQQQEEEKKTLDDVDDNIIQPADEELLEVAAEVETDETLEKELLVFQEEPEAVEHACQDVHFNLAETGLEMELESPFPLEDPYFDENFLEKGQKEKMCCSFLFR